ncbi:unnamed protein product, partial [Mesorhabditis spiculigera]
MRLILLLLAGCYLSSAQLFHQVVAQLGPETVSCFRILNATHQFGCQTERDGNVGAVIRFTNPAETRLIKECWKARYPDWDGGFAVLIDDILLHEYVHFAGMIKPRSSSNIALMLQRAPCVRSVLVLPTDLRDPLLGGLSRSDDQLCPNSHSTLYEQCGQWNRNGIYKTEGLVFTDWNKPVVVLKNKTNIDMVSACADAVNKANGTAGDWPIYFPICAINIKVFSYAAGNSALCMSRSEGTTLELDNPVTFCDPLQDYNVFIEFPARQAAQRKVAPRQGKYLAIATRMDSLSFIPEHSPGEMSAIATIMTVLTAAKIVANERTAFEKASNSSNRHVLFSFLHGEAYDYIGSSRMVYDMDHDAFPSPFNEKLKAQKELIKPEQLEAFIDVQHIIHGEDYILHVDDEAYKREAKLTNVLIEAARKSLRMQMPKANLTEKIWVLPPSSAYSFVRRNAPGLQSAMVFAQFDEMYQYPRINSMMDINHYTLESQLTLKLAIRQGAEALAAMAREYVGVTTAGKRLDDSYVNELYNCFIDSDDWWSCRLFQAVLEPVASLKPAKLSKTTYIGADGHSIIRNIVTGLAVEATGRPDATSNVADAEQCDQLNHQQNLYRYTWQRDYKTNTSRCLKSTVFLTKALSPAFTEEGVDLATTKWPTWTEASYTVAHSNKQAGPQMFLVEPSHNELHAMIGAGIFAWIVALVFHRIGTSIFVINEGEPQAEAGEPL